MTRFDSASDRLTTTARAGRARAPYVEDLGNEVTPMGQALPRSTNSMWIPRAVVPRAVEEDAPVGDPRLYFNRELSWLDFDFRVLAQARDERLPLLERVRFLAITQSNLDEFFATRVGGLKRQLHAGVKQRSPDGRTPEEQLDAIRKAGLDLQTWMTRTWEEELLPALVREGIRVLPPERLDERQSATLQAHFRSCVYPILTPLAIDPGHRFPFTSHLSLSLLVLLRHPRTGALQFARVKIPTDRRRFVSVDEGGTCVPVEEVVRAHVGELFPGMTVEGAYLFRVTRSADLPREAEASDLLAVIAEELRERRFAPVVRLEIEEGCPDHAIELLETELELDEREVYTIDGLQGLGDLTEIANLDRPSLRFEPWEPIVPASFAVEPGEARDVFGTIRRGDILVHHPYESYTATVEQFVNTAAEDPHVLAIKHTVYRTSEDSPTVRALIRAAERGKQVAVLVELQARFDEERNLEWAERLEDAGVHVTYGIMGLKTHAKLTLVVREESSGIVSYCHVGTGNYHPRTATLYTDFGLFTASPSLGTDVINLFHFLTGYAPEQRYDKLLVAPHHLRNAFHELIDAEIEHQRRTGEGRIVAKMNNLDDTDVIDRLYLASQAGVSIDLVVRGHCRLRPGLPGMSENIRVISILGRFLEHDRIYLFGNGGRPRIFIGSADWRRRNLEERVEAIVEVENAELKERLSHTLELALSDNRLAWDLDSTGHYRQRRPAEGEEERDYHRMLMEEARRRRVQRGC